MPPSYCFGKAKPSHKEYNFKNFTNLQNVLKIDVLAKKTEDHQFTKMVLQMLSIHISHSLHISESLSIIRQNIAVPVESAGKLDIKFY